MEDKKYIKTFKLLLPYLWPKKRIDLRTRVSFAVVALVLAKIASVGTPLVLGEAVNSLTELSAGINLFMLVPVALIVGYGVARIISFTFVAIRDALFSKVSQHSIRQISLNLNKIKYLFVFINRIFIIIYCSIVLAIIVVMLKATSSIIVGFFV